MFDNIEGFDRIRCYRKKLTGSYSYECPQESDQLKGLGNTAFNRKNFELALRLYSHAIRKNRDQHILYSNRSITHFNLQEYKVALLDAEKCIELNPKWGEGYHRKAAALVELGQIGEAHMCYL